MTPLSHIPTPSEARRDPDHQAWFVFADAVEAVRRDPCERTRAAVQPALDRFLESMKPSVSVGMAEVA